MGLRVGALHMLYTRRRTLVSLLPSWLRSLYTKMFVAVLFRFRLVLTNPICASVFHSTYRIWVAYYFSQATSFECICNKHNSHASTKTTGAQGPSCGVLVPAGFGGRSETDQTTS